MKEEMQAVAEMLEKKGLWGWYSIRVAREISGYEYEITIAEKEKHVEVTADIPLAEGGEQEYYAQELLKAINEELEYGAFTLVKGKRTARYRVYSLKGGGDRGADRVEAMLAGCEEALAQYGERIRMRRRPTVSDRFFSALGFVHRTAADQD